MPLLPARLFKPHPGTSYKGREVEPLRGMSMANVLSGKANIVHENDTATSWEMFEMRAVWQGDYKLLWLVELFGPDHWQLFESQMTQVKQLTCQQKCPIFVTS